MTLQDLGNIGEFSGAIAVLVSLIYLALQIRQNTTTVRAGTSAAISESLARLLEVAGSDARTARLWTGGLTGDPSLDPNDVLQFSVLFGSYMRRIENAYYQHLLGLVDSDHWQTTERTLRYMIRSNGGKTWWVWSRQIYSDRFVAYVENCIVEREVSSAVAQAVEPGVG